jgi:hypothetical protein
MDELQITATNVDELPATPDKLDKYKDFLVGRRKLTVSEQKMFENYRKAFSWRCKGFSPQNVKQMLMQDANIEYAMAARILQESTQLYGLVEDIDKEGTRRILIENLHIAMSIAIRAKDSNGVISATEKIAKLSKLYDDSPSLKPSDLMPAKTVVFNRLEINNFNSTQTYEAATESGD